MTQITRGPAASTKYDHTMCVALSSQYFVDGSVGLVPELHVDAWETWGIVLVHDMCATT
jgi:hypothetical protein